MKRCFTALVLMAALVPAVHANMINGSIGFGSLGVTTDNPVLADATSFTVSDAFVTSRTGDYSSVPAFTAATFNGFTFNPVASSVTPLWTFTIGTKAYSFDATSLSASYDATHNQWNISGTGTAYITGFDPTPGTLTANLNASGETTVFSAASAAASVDDSGSTAAILAAGICCMGVVRKKIAS